MVEDAVGIVDARLHRFLNQVDLDQVQVVGQQGGIGTPIPSIWISFSIASWQATTSRCMKIARMPSAVHDRSHCSRRFNEARRKFRWT